MTGHTGLPDFERIKRGWERGEEALPTWAKITEEKYDEMVAEMNRLYAIESAALGVTATMPRRNGKPYSFTMATMGEIERLDESLTQGADDGDETSSTD